MIRRKNERRHERKLDRGAPVTVDGKEDDDNTINVLSNDIFLFAINMLGALINARSSPAARRYHSITCGSIIHLLLDQLNAFSFMS